MCVFESKEAFVQPVKSQRLRFNHAKVDFILVVMETYIQSYTTKESLRKAAQEVMRILEGVIVPRTKSLRASHKKIVRGTDLEDDMKRLLYDDVVS